MFYCCCFKKYPRLRNRLEKKISLASENSSSYAKRREELDQNRKAVLLRKQDELREQSRIDSEKRKEIEQQRKQQKRLTTQELLEGKSSAARIIEARDHYGGGPTRRANINSLPSDSCSSGS